MQPADQILDDNYLIVRAKLLEIAATLDRLDRAVDADGPLDEPQSDARQRIDDAIRILLSEGPDRAERLQHLFSRSYESDWRKQMQL